MTITTLVVDILKLGLTGLVFLLMYLGFRLLHKEQAKAAPSSDLLKRASLYVWQAIVIAALVGAVELGHRVLGRGADGGTRLQACVSEIESLNRVSQHPDQTLNTLRAAITSTWTACGRPGE